MNAAIRLRGLLLCVVGFGLAYALMALQLGLGGGPLVVSGVPGAVGLVGLIELLSGYPFYQVARRWDAMHGLARFVLGLALIAAFVVAFWWGAETFYFSR